MTEEKVTFAIVTLCGGSYGSEIKEQTKYKQETLMLSIAWIKHSAPATLVVKVIYINTPPSPSRVQLDTEAL